MSKKRDRKEDEKELSKSEYRKKKLKIMKEQIFFMSSILKTLKGTVDELSDVNKSLTGIYGNLADINDALGRVVK
jgi:hypothetical protein